MSRWIRWPIIAITLPVPLVLFIIVSPCLWLADVICRAWEETL